MHIEHVAFTNIYVFTYICVRVCVYTRAISKKKGGYKFEEELERVYGSILKEEIKKAKLLN